MLEVKDYLKLA